MRKPVLTLGLLTSLAIGAGCVQQPQTKIAELDPYVGSYPPPISPLARKAEPQPPPVTPGSLKNATIVIDAGHGGHDPGARGLSADAEKHINLGIAMKLAGSLQSRGARVVTTRNSDHFVELDDRAAMADRTGADLFVSIHSDSSKKSGVSGTTIFVSRQASPQSDHAARCIAAALSRAGIECRGVNSAGYRVLVGHSRPAVLIECGFLTNRADAQRLNSSAYQAKLAEAIAEGIIRHFGG